MFGILLEFHPGMTQAVDLAVKKKVEQLSVRFFRAFLCAKFFFKVLKTKRVRLDPPLCGTILGRKSHQQ